jgi:hypothetical protein
MSGQVKETMYDEYIKNLAAMTAEATEGLEDDEAAAVAVATMPTAMMQAGAFIADVLAHGMAEQNRIAQETLNLSKELAKHTIASLETQQKAMAAMEAEIAPETTRVPIDEGPFDEEIDELIRKAGIRVYTCGVDQYQLDHKLWSIRANVAEHTLTWMGTVAYPQPPQWFMLVLQTLKGEEDIANDWDLTELGIVLLNTPEAVSDEVADPAL